MGRRALLNEKQVAEIRANPDKSVKHFANLFCVNKNTISAVRNCTGAYALQSPKAGNGDSKAVSIGTNPTGVRKSENDDEVPHGDGGSTQEADASGDGNPSTPGYQSLFNVLFRS